MTVSKAFSMYIERLTAWLDMQEEKSWLQEGKKLHEYLELILKHWTCFIWLITAYLLTLNVLSISSSSRDLKIKG